MGDKVIVREEFLAADFTEEVSGRVGRPFGLFLFYVVLSSKFWVFFLPFSSAYLQHFLPLLQLAREPEVRTNNRPS